MYDVISEEEVVIKYEYLIFGNMYKYFAGFINGNKDEYEDILNECRMAIVNAYRSYTPKEDIDNEYSFKCYCSRCIYYAIVSYINNRHYNKSSEISIQTLVDEDKSENHTIEDRIGIYDDISIIEVKMYFDFAETLGKEYKQILYYISKGYKNRDIAKFMNEDYRKMCKMVRFLKDNIKKEFKIEFEPIRTNGKVIALEMNGDYISEYENLSQAEEKLGCDRHTIRKLAQGNKGRKGVYSKILNKRIKFIWG